MEGFNNFGLAWLISQGETNLSGYSRKIIFTPKGKIKFLPKRATGWDAAYAINPNLGARVQKVRVQVREGDEIVMQELSPAADVPNGALIEIIPGQPARAPIAEALHYVTAPTRLVIEQQLRMQERDINVEKGRGIMTQVLSARGIQTLEDLERLDVQGHFALLTRLGVQSRNELYCDVGATWLSVEEVNATLDSLGITKEKKGWSTILFRGPDHFGVLRDLSGMIGAEEMNILVVSNMRTSGETGQVEYEVRMVVDGMTEAKRLSLEDKLKQTSCVWSWQIV